MTSYVVTSSGNLMPSYGASLQRRLPKMMKIYTVYPGKVLLSARTHTLTDEQCAALVKDHGLTGVVNLWHTPDDRMQRLVPWYEQISLPDGQISPRMAQVLESLADDVAAETHRHGKVLLHCWGGRNRSGLLAALVLKRLERISGAVAYDRVRQVRRGALVNLHFARYLKEQP
jgi:hypothetical protein